MKWLGVNEIRSDFLKFFESKGHKIINSYSLVPNNDNSLLLINSGMAPMKPYFLGSVAPPSNRVVTCQKCIRTPDIENVGKTSRHGTFFEMLGNFSFGDYFKTQAIEWSWEFLTNFLKLPVDKLYISVYYEDQESFDIWHEKIGIPKNKIFKLGKEDNFWEIGSGPCGPCSEIYFDRGEKFGCNSKTCQVGCNCDRFVEFWNLVFSQYNSDGDGNYFLMDNPNIDTGMGLERLACIIQQVDNIFEIDTIKNIISYISTLSGISYNQSDKLNISFRVIADHIRSITFMIFDGIIPSNEGRGYVLRRLIRRAFRHGKILGIDNLFLYKVLNVVIDENIDFYPELNTKLSYIENTVKNEEAIFQKTIDKGIQMLDQMIDENLKTLNTKSLSGKLVFSLYDTFGFPVDITKEILEEKKFTFDIIEFEKLMEEQRKQSRSSRKLDINIGWTNDLILNNIDPTNFCGYSDNDSKSKVVAIIFNNYQLDSISDSCTFSLILDRTPFYAEGGGQVGDSGIIFSDNCQIMVTDCKKNSAGNFIHICKLKSGILNVNDIVDCKIDVDRRDNIKKNHTSAHILQFVLREILGDHVFQSGQYVDNKGIRFDFSHFNPLSFTEISLIENRINEIILSGLDVNIYETTLNQARKNGVFALFDQKYSDIVRVVDISGTSVELCGGTHVDNTLEIGLFKITSESSISAGIRRITAITGKEILNLVNNYTDILNKACNKLKIQSPDDIVPRCVSLISELKNKDADIEKLNNKLADTQLDLVVENAQIISGIRITYAAFSRMNAEALRTIGDKIKNMHPDIVAVLSSIIEGKGILIAVCGHKAVQLGVNAGGIIREMSRLLGGKGGGRADSAMAGVTDIFKIDEVLTQLPSVVQKMIISK